MVVLILMSSFIYRTFSAASETASDCKAKGGNCKVGCDLGEANVGSAFCRENPDGGYCCVSIERKKQEAGPTNDPSPDENQQ